MHVKLQLDIDLANAGQEVDQLKDFVRKLSEICGEQNTPAEAVKPSPEKAPVPAGDVKEPSGGTSQKTPALTIAQVRAVLATKVEKHRGEIKDKLTKLGAANVSTLDPDKYEEFFKYLESLE